MQTLHQHVVTSEHLKKVISNSFILSQQYSLYYVSLNDEQTELQLLLYVIPFYYRLCAAHSHYNDWHTTLCLIVSPLPPLFRVRLLVTCRDGFCVCDGKSSVLSSAAVRRHCRAWFRINWDALFASQLECPNRCSKNTSSVEAIVK